MVEHRIRHFHKLLILATTDLGYFVGIASAQEEVLSRLSPTKVSRKHTSECHVVVATAYNTASYTVNGPRAIQTGFVPSKSAGEFRAHSNVANFLAFDAKPAHK